MLLNNQNSPILITGAQRSGSSIIAKIIKQAGAFVGNVSAMDENFEIRQNIVEKYYLNSGIPSKAQYPLPNTGELLIPTNWKNKVNQALIGQGLTENQIWAYKSNTNCQIWPVWNHAFPNAKWIIVRRRTGDIVSSCMKTAYMTAFKDKSNQKLVGASNEQEGWLWWVHEHEKLFVEMIEAGLNCKIIWPERMASGDYSQIYEMLEWLGLEWKDSIIKSIEPLMSNSKQKERK